MVVGTRDGESSGPVAGATSRTSTTSTSAATGGQPLTAAACRWISPATEEVVALVGQPGRADATAAAEAAGRAFRGPWPDLPLTERIDMPALLRRT